MAGSEPPAAGDERVERQRRQEALDALARQQRQATGATTAAGSAQPAGVPRRARRGLWVALALVVVLAAAVGTVVLRGRQTPHPTVVARPLQITSAFADLACIVDTAWSPDGRRIAVVGYQEACPDARSSRPHVTGEVNIYDTTTGHLTAQWSLDDLLLQDSHVTLDAAYQDPVTGNPFAPAIAYTDVLWSADGQRIAVPFVVFQAPYAYPNPNEVPPQLAAIPPARTATTVGVLLTTADGRSPRVLTAPYRFPQTIAPIAEQEWDLRAGMLVNPSVALPPALSYTWSASGGPLPQAKLPLTNGTPPSAPPLAPVGTPLGGQAFTLWQPGQLAEGIAYKTTSQGFAPDVHLWYPNFAIWSPDGRYLITPAYYGGRMLLPGQSPAAATLAATGQTQAPVLPVRDAGLLAAYQASPPLATVAWRPDGWVLAARSLKFDANLISHDVVTLYDCASGKVLARFEVGPASQDSPYAGPFGIGPSGDIGVWLRWSPDGSRLQLFSGGRGTITIWGPSLLPKG